MAIFCITGGTGLVGRRLTERLVNAGHQVVVLTRHPAQHPSTASVKYAAWDIHLQTIDADAVRSCDYIIHLAGAGVAEKRWTPARKMEIRNSRVISGQLLVNTLREPGHHVKAVISASAIGWYGPDRGKVFTEEDAAYHDFLGETCVAWEESMAPLKSLGIRWVTLRIGIVLSRNGGAFVEFMKPLQWGIAAILGNGKQIISWIHIDDLCRMMEFAANHVNIQGVYNAVAPYPVSNKTLVLAMGKQMRGKFFIPVFVPAFVLKVMLGEMSIEVLKSCTVSSKKITESGFQFIYPSIESALPSLMQHT